MDRLNSIKGAIFDMDGTILDSMWVWHEIDRKFLLGRNIDIPDDFATEINQLSFSGTAAYTIERFNFSDTPEELMEIWLKMAHDAYANDVKLKPCAKEYLEYLRSKGIKLGIASALSPALMKPVLVNNGIDGYFEKIVSVSEVERGKGSPDIYLEVAKRLEIQPYECAVFEDIYVGIASAKQAGFLTVAVHEEASCDHINDIKATADIYINDYSELLNANR